MKIIVMIKMHAETQKKLFARKKLNTHKKKKKKKKKN